MLINAHQNPRFHHVLGIQAIEVVRRDATDQQITKSIVLRRQDFASAFPFVIIVFTHCICCSLTVSSTLAINQHVDRRWEQLSFANLTVTVYLT